MTTTLPHAAAHIGIAMLIVAILVLAWAIVAAALRRRDQADADRRAEDATVQRFRECEADTDYDWIDGTRPSALKAEDRDAHAALQAARWHGMQ